MVKYKYESVKIALGGTLKEDHQEIINQYARRGYRFVGIVPTKFNGSIMTNFDLVFEKE